MVIVAIASYGMGQLVLLKRAEGWRSRSKGSAAIPRFVSAILLRRDTKQLWMRKEHGAGEHFIMSFCIGKGTQKIIKV